MVPRPPCAAATAAEAVAAQKVMDVQEMFEHECHDHQLTAIIASSAVANAAALRRDNQACRASTSARRPPGLVET